MSMKNNKKRGNVSSKENIPHKWTKEEMEEAEPCPIPEIDDEKEDDESKQKESKGFGKKI